METEIYLIASLLLNVIEGIMLIIVMNKKPETPGSLVDLLTRSLKSDTELKILSNELEKVRLIQELNKPPKKGKKT